MSTAEQRLARIAQTHGQTRRIWVDNDQAEVCAECEIAAPCPTYVWATTDRDATAPWQPAPPIGPPAIPEPPAAAAKTPCPEGFHWIGQSYASCDQCGLPAWEHDGEARLDPLAGPFDRTAGYELRPWADGEADRIRVNWDPDLPLWTCRDGVVRHWARRADEDEHRPPLCPRHGSHPLVATTRGLG